MSKTQDMTWWKEHLSGLETDACPAVDFPDNENGGVFDNLSTAAGELPDRDNLTAAFAYTLAKFTCQTESLFWIREDEAVFPFFTSFDETAPAQVYREDVAERRNEAHAFLGPDEEELAENLQLNRDLLLSFDPDFVPDAAQAWKICLRQDEGELTLFYRKDWYRAENMRRLAEMVVRIAKQLPSCETLRDMMLIGDDDCAQLASFPFYELPPSAENVPAILRRAFTQYPDNIAVVFEGETLTYAQLDRKTDAIAYSALPPTRQTPSLHTSLK